MSDPAIRCRHASRYKADRVLQPQRDGKGWSAVPPLAVRCRRPRRAGGVEDGLRKENQRLREALERIRDGAGSNTVCGNDYTDRRAHTFGGIYRIAADVVGERSLDALAGGKGDL